MIDQLITDINNNEPVALTDEKLIELAHAVALELRSRLPLDAIRSGDLSGDLEDQAKVRRAFHAAALDLKFT